MEEHLQKSRAAARKQHPTEMVAQPEVPVPALLPHVLRQEEMVVRHPVARTKKKLPGER